MLNALGIINIEDSTVDITGLQSYRPVSAISILGRYRVIDFMLSNFSNSGIKDIQVCCREKPRSLIEHLGSGLQYNISSKKGRLRMMFGETSGISDVYNHDIANFMSNMQYIEENDKSYVVIAPSYMMYRANFSDILDSHIESGNDVTVLYKVADNAKEDFIGCDCLTLEKDKRVSSIDKNRGKYKKRNISLEAYVLSRTLFIELVKLASETSSLYWFKDILADVLDKYKVVGYPIRTHVSCVNTLSAYFKTNMKYCSLEGVSELRVDTWPIHTMTSDSAPVTYGTNSSVKNSLIANGCNIDGTLENCVVGRNVTVKKGAVLKNCVILPNAYIAEDVKLDHVVVDKAAIINHVKKLEGSVQAPIYVKRRDRI